METNQQHDYIYLPPRATSVTLKEVQRRVNSPYRLDFGIPQMDARLISPIPGDLTGILGRPGHAKTTTMISLSRRWGKILQSQKDSHGRSPLVVYATWETMVEEFTAVYTAQDSGQSLESIGRGTASIQRIENALVKSLSNNVVVIGRSGESMGESGIRTRPPTPTLFDLDMALQKLKSDGHSIAILFVDYLQRIPHPRYNGEHDRSARVSENTEILKDLAMAHQLATVMGVQAKREVDDYAGLKIPTLSDAQWASTIEQTADKLWGITLPSKYHEVGKTIEVYSWRYQVTHQTLAFRSLKQRFGPQSEKDVWILDLDLANAEIREHKTSGEAEPY